MGASVVGGLALGVPAAFVLVRSRRRRLTSAALTPAVYAPVAVPGVMIGIALLTAAAFLNLQVGLVASGLAHILIATPYIVLVLRSRLLAMDIRIEEAAKDLGANPLKVFFDITLTLLKPSLIAAALLAAAVSLDELLVTNFTIGTGTTLPVWVLGQIRRGLTPGINALAVMLCVASLLIIGVVAVLLRGSLVNALRGGKQ
jgi:ABC-type spermidine/putrescine transport system permease subunit II